MKKSCAIVVQLLLSCTVLTRLLPAAEEIQELNCLGKPKAYQQGERAVYALWYGGDDKWHLEVHGARNEKVHYHGRISVSSGQIVDVKFAYLERMKDRKNADFFVPTPNKMAFDFSFASVGDVDGVGFKASDPTAKLKCELIIGHENDPRLDPYGILIGAEGNHPTENPFLLPAVPPNAKDKKKSKPAEKTDPQQTEPNDK